jgi:hypothetical protein
VGGFQLLQHQSLLVKAKLYDFADAGVSAVLEGEFQIINMRPQSRDLCQQRHDRLLYDTVQSSAKGKSGSGAVWFSTGQTAPRGM